MNGLQIALQQAERIAELEAEVGRLRPFERAVRQCPNFEPGMVRCHRNHLHVRYRS